MEFDREKFVATVAALADQMVLPIQQSFQWPPQSNNIHIFNELSSTNQTLWELLAQGAEPGTVVIALQQSAGRGQWGRQWLSDPGGLYLSWAIAPNLSLSQSAELSLGSAWGIATVLSDRTLPVFVKWPNDLILEGRKLGGILIETKVHQQHISTAIIGVGMNWSNPVPETGINLHSFLESLEPAERDRCNITSLETLAALILSGLATGYSYAQQKGIEKLVCVYEELLSCKGRPVVVDSRRGTVVGVTTTGELRVEFDSPTPAPEVHLKPGEIRLGVPISQGDQFC